jgi:hypothetical protein
MNEYVAHRLIADRQATIASTAMHNAQVREAVLAVRRSRTGERSLARFSWLTVRRYAAAPARVLLAGPVLAPARD